MEDDTDSDGDDALTGGGARIGDEVEDEPSAADPIGGGGGGGGKDSEAVEAVEMVDARWDGDCACGGGGGGIVFDPPAVGDDAAAAAGGGGGGGPEADAVVV